MEVENKTQKGLNASMQQQKRKWVALGWQLKRLWGKEESGRLEIGCQGEEKGEAPEQCAERSEGVMLQEIPCGQKASKTVWAH